MRPVVVWPEMSSPAQSLASVTHPTSASSGAPTASTLFLVSPAAAGASAGTFFWQNAQDRMRQDRTSSSPVKKVMRLEQRKAYQCRSLRHSASDISGSLSAIGHVMATWPSQLSGRFRRLVAHSRSTSVGHRPPLGPLSTASRRLNVGGPPRGSMWPEAKSARAPSRAGTLPDTFVLSGRRTEMSIYTADIPHAVRVCRVDRRCCCCCSWNDAGGDCSRDGVARRRHQSRDRVGWPPLVADLIDCHVMPLSGSSSTPPAPTSARCIRWNTRDKHKPNQRGASHVPSSVGQLLSDDRITTEYIDNCHSPQELARVYQKHLSLSTPVVFHCNASWFVQEMQ